jgi:Flp pilus assembly protein TadD
MEAKEGELRKAVLSSGTATPLTESTGISVSVGQGRERKAAGAAAGEERGAEIERQLRGVVAKSLNDAGTVLARGHDYPGALPLFREAAGADPTLSPVMRNLGLAAFHTGNYAEAVAAFTRALEQNPADALVSGYLERARALQPAPATTKNP